MRVLETERLTIRWLNQQDDEFIFELLNTPSWIQYIGDKGIKTIEDARNYIMNGPIESYAKWGFGLYAVELRDSSTRLGICGLIKRETLDDIDIGYAFLPDFWGQGYALEAANGVVMYAKNHLNLQKLVAITSIDNHNSEKLLMKLGFDFERMIQMNGGVVKLFSSSCLRC